MSEMITVRDLAMVTSDIQYAQRQGARQLVSNLIEIGRLLTEARGMVPPAEWESYIQDNFGYSTSSADNWMKLYREYGNDQESLFDSFRDSQTFGKLSYTQLLALTAVPPEERAEFAEQNHIEDMSTRELQKAIRERDEARADLDKAQERMVDMKADLDDTKFYLEKARNSIKDHMEDNQKLRDQAKAAEDRRNAGEQKLAAMEKELAAAKSAEEAAQKALEQAQKEPQVPEAVLETMRKEAEAQAAKKAREEMDKKLKTAQEKAGKELEAARAQVEAAQKATQQASQERADAIRRLEGAQKAAKIQNPDLMAIQVLAQKLMGDWNVILGHRMKAVSADADNAEPTAAFLRKVLETMGAGITGQVAG